MESVYFALQLSSNGSTSSDLSTPPTPQWTYSNPDMEIFRQRRLSQQNQTMHRLSLADVITDWPSLEYIEKPEYRMPEVWLGSIFKLAKQVAHCCKKVTKKWTVCMNNQNADTVDSKLFWLKAALQGRIFNGEQRSVTPASLEHCSRLSAVPLSPLFLAAQSGAALTPECF